MRLIVTGSSGLLGHPVARHLSSLGHQVIGLDRVAPRTASSFQHHVTDLTDFAWLIEQFHDADALIHIAAVAWFGTDTPPEQAAGLADNLTSASAVMEAAVACKIPRILYASSLQVYGLLGPGDSTMYCDPQFLPVDETHPCRPSRPYSISKLVGELLLDSAARRIPGCRAISLRLPTIRRKRATSAPMSDAELGWAFAGTHYSFLHIEDACRAFELALIHAPPGHTPLNILSPTAERPWSMTLLQNHWQRVPDPRSDLRADQALYSAARAKQLIGFEAKVH
jgi:UDP-glucose 4-epimerase